MLLLIKLAIALSSGFVILALLTSITAPFGARLAHRLDRVRLKQAFAVFLAITASNLLYEALVLQIGGVRLRDVEAMVIERGLDTSLLGQSFLNRLEQFQVRGQLLRLQD